MWEPQRLTSLWASTACCYRDGFTFFKSSYKKKSVINSWMWVFCVWKSDTSSLFRIQGCFTHVMFHLNIHVQQNKDKGRAVCLFRNFAVRLHHSSQRYTTYSIIAKMKLGPIASEVFSFTVFLRSKNWGRSVLGVSQNATNESFSCRISCPAIILPVFCT
jgi:hypothetical protein